MLKPDGIEIAKILQNFARFYILMQEIFRLRLRFSKNAKSLAVASVNVQHILVGQIGNWAQAQVNFLSGNFRTGTRPNRERLTIYANVF